MRLFFSSASFDTSYGGPAYSVPRLALSLAQTGAEVALWASDGTTPDLGTSAGGLGITCLSGSLKEAVSRFGRVDLFHDSGLWLPHNHAIATTVRRAKTPLIVSTRGMLDPWARRHKWLKKKIAWHLYQGRNLAEASGIHVTSRLEAAHLDAMSLKPPVTYIPNGVDLPPMSNMAFVQPAPAPIKTAVFLGRIYPVKGLAMLVEAWAKIRPEGWELVLAGPDEAGHRAELETQIRQRGLTNCIRFAGAVSGQAKSDLLAASSLFILPSYSESFGVVVAEALAHGLPVLTTTAVPWPQLEPRQCGWRAAPNADALSVCLEQATGCSRKTLAAMGRAGRTLVKTDFGWQAIAQEFVSLYSSHIGRTKGRTKERTP